MKGLDAKGDVSGNILNTKVDEDKNRRLNRRMIMYNCYENIILFMVLLNSVIYPSASSGLYYIYALVMTALSLTNEERKIKLKFGLTVCIIVLSFAIIISKGLFLIMLNNTGLDLDLTQD